MTFFAASYPAFLLTCLIIELTPGPNMTYLALLSSMHGKKAGLYAVAGVALGLLAVGIAAIFGAAVFLQDAPPLLHALSLAGACYFFWLAWEAWHTETTDGDKPATQPLSCFWRGLITNLLSPKTFLFYATIVPQFIEQDANFTLQFIVLTLLYVTVATSVHTALVLLANKLTPYLQNPKAARWTARIFAALLAAIGLWFLISSM